MSDRGIVRGRAAAALVLAASLAAAGCNRESDAAPVADPEVRVGPENVLVVAERELASGPTISGTLAARVESQVRAEVSGVVLQVLVDAGQPVRRGQVLARIEAAALRDAVVSAESAVRSATVATETARRNVERNEALSTAGALAERDLETARNQYAAAQAQLAGARAQLASAREQLGKTTVTAPIRGIVSAKPVSTGDVVAPGAALFTVIDPGSLRFEGAVPAAQVGELRTGAPVRFRVAGYAETFTGTIERINPAADPQTRQVPVTVSVSNEGGRLVAGLFAEGRVEAASRRGIAIPATAVDERGVQPFVLRVKGGRAERVPVRLGMRDPEAEAVEVTGGLAAGDTLLTGGALGTTERTRVRVGRAAAPAAAADPSAAGN